MAPRRKLIIDTDPGVDDALAIFMAFNSDEARVQRALRMLLGVRKSVAQERDRGTPRCRRTCMPAMRRARSSRART